MPQPVEVQTPGDESKATAYVAKGVHQGFSLSPTLFSTYTDTYVDQLRHETEREEESRGPMERWDVTLIADDVKLQAHNEAILQKLLNYSSAWAARYGMEWSANKCVVFREAATDNEHTMELSGRQVAMKTELEYLGIMASATGTTHTKEAERVKKATSALLLLRNNRVHSGTVNTHTLLGIWKTYILPRVSYGLHLVPMHNELKDASDAMKETMMITKMRCFSERTRPRLRTVTRALTLTIKEK